MVDPKRLEEYLKSTSLTYKTRSNSYIFTCPRCLKKEKLYIRRKDGVFCCWFCKETSRFKGKPEYALSELLNIPVSAVKEKLYDIAPITDEPRVFLNLNLREFLDPEDELEEYIPKINWPWNYYPIDHNNSKKGLEYLIRRGIGLDLASKYGLRYCPQRRRVAFPIINDGVLVGYQERLVINNKFFNEETEDIITTPKILSSENVPRDHLLMFSDRITSNHVVLCEGPIDCIKADLCGGNVAAMGKAVAKGQIDSLIKAGVNKIYLALDPDALDETARLVRDSFPDMDCYVMLPPKPFKDLGEMPCEAVFEVFKSAVKVNKATLFAFMRR